MGCGASSKPGIIPLEAKRKIPILSETHYSVIENHYDVVIVGSGYGGAIAASRAARAGKSVCVLERGKEWLPGDFPEETGNALKEMQVKTDGESTRGNTLGLYEFIVSDDVTILKGCGLGGTSLINANVCLEADDRIFTDTGWPQDFKDDLDSFKCDIKKAEQMLQPAVYSKDTTKSTELRKVATKFQASLTDIEDMGKLFAEVRKKDMSDLHYKTPIHVTTHTKHEQSNHVGVPQPQCNGCGNCCGGCNTGAKNTVNMNYLPDAKYHGAVIFTQVKVMSIQQGNEDGRWNVKYQRYHGNKIQSESQIVTSDIVILGAGALGSTEILSRSKEDGLNISDFIGKGFSGNGDQLGMSFCNDNEANVLATASDSNNTEDSPGPCITSVVDMRKLGDNIPYHQQLILEDATIAKSMIPVFKALLYMASPFFSYDNDSSDDWSQFVDKLSGDAVDKTLPVLAISHDHVDENGGFRSGNIQLDKDGVRVYWKCAGENPNYKTIDKAYKIASSALGGTFLENPLWSDRFKHLFKGRGTLSVHPLGGCSMGESGTSGVVNHKGQVFEGNTGNVLKGLYVVDGAVIPRSVGVNPLLTICGVAERCMRLMAEDYRWKINYDFVTNPSEIVWERQVTPGVKVKEFMTGNFSDLNNQKSSSFKLSLTLLSDDLVNLVERDPNHEMLCDGIVTCKMLSKKPMTAKGSVQMFTFDSGPRSQVGQRHMTYRLKLYPANSKRIYVFHGSKNIRKDDDLEILGLDDCTTLRYKVYNQADESGLTEIGQGKLVMPITELLKSIKTLEVTNVKGGFVKQLSLKATFFKLFLGETFDIYSPFSSSQIDHFRIICREIAPHIKYHVIIQNVSFHRGIEHNREKRPLNIPEYAQPQVYKILTDDNQVNRLIRYQGGTKGPVLLIHGHGTYSILFTMDTIGENMVEFLVKKKYDVWMIDWRCASNRHSASLPYTLDDVAKYDIPSAVDRVLKETNHQDLQVVCHCMGSQVFWMSVLLGYLEGKIRCVVNSQGGITPMPSPFNKVKLDIHLNEVFNKVLGIKAMDVYDDELDWKDRLYQKVAKTFADTATNDNRCKNSICHKLTAVYGLLWEHKQLNNDTHRTLHELFGTGSFRTFSHLAKCLRAQRLVGFEDEELYVPGFSFDKEKRQASPVYKERMKRCNMPMLLLMSELNGVYKAPETLKTMHELVLEANPGNSHLFEYLLVKDYGHLDVIMGKNANRDIYPKIVAFLDKYAHNDMEYNDRTRATMENLLTDGRIKGKPMFCAGLRCDNDDGICIITACSIGPVSKCEMFESGFGTWKRDNQSMSESVLFEHLSLEQGIG